MESSGRVALVNIRLQLKTPRANIARNLAVASTNLIVAILMALFFLPVQRVGFPNRLLDFKLARAVRVEASREAEVAFEVHLLAEAGLSPDHTFELLTVETDRGRLKAHVRHCLTQEALAVPVTTIVGRPEFKVRIGGAWRVGTLALLKVQRAEVNEGKERFGLLVTLLGVVRLYHSMDKELLGHTLRLDNDVMDKNRCFRNIDDIPSQTFVKTEFELGRWLVFLSDDD